MNQTDALTILDSWDRKGRYVFTKGDLTKLFSETGGTLDRTLERLTGKGTMVRAAYGVYVYGLSRNIGGFTLQEIAKTLRRGDYNYLSLESALSEWGVISQIPIDRITVMTTGRKGEFRTPYGIIEFTHTDLNPQVIVANTIERDSHPLRIATEDLAIKNQRRVGRNSFLIEENE
jgi:predicted transcriptional regulator of viral defense system